MLCRSCAAAFAQYLEDQGGFPLFTIEGAALSSQNGSVEIRIVSDHSRSEDYLLTEPSVLQSPVFGSCRHRSSSLAETTL